MNKENIINELLSTEKNISNNYSIAVNEMSNDSLYKEIYSLLKESKDMSRKLFNYAYECGYYNLEDVKKSKINDSFEKYNNKFKELE